MKEFILGKRERFSWVAEDDFDTGGDLSTGEVVGLNVDVRPNFSLSWQEILTAGQDTRGTLGRKVGKRKYPYNLNFTPVNWRWLKYLMSVEDSSDGDAKIHTFSLANTVNTFKAEWAKRHTNNIVYTMTGNFIKSATISWNKPTGEGSEGFVRVSAECVARNNSKGTSVTTLSDVTKDPFQFRMVKVVINGTEITEVNNGEMNINNGIDENDSIYSNATHDELIGSPIPKVFRLTGRFNINVSDDSLFQLWDAGTEVSGENSITFDRDGTGNDQIKFTFKGFYLNNPVEPTNLEGVNNVDLNWVADEFDSVVARDDIETY